VNFSIEKLISGVFKYLGPRQVSSPFREVPLYLLLLHKSHYKCWKVVSCSEHRYLDYLASSTIIAKLMGKTSSCQLILFLER